MKRHAQILAFAGLLLVLVALGGVAGLVPALPSSPGENARMVVAVAGANLVLVAASLLVGLAWYLLHVRLAHG